MHFKNIRKLNQRYVKGMHANQMGFTVGTQVCLTQKISVNHHINEIR